MSKIEQTNENGAYRNQYVWDLQDKVKRLNQEIAQIKDNNNLYGAMCDLAFDKGRLEIRVNELTSSNDSMVITLSEIAAFAAFHPNNKELRDIKNTIESDFGDNLLSVNECAKR